MREFSYIILLSPILLTDLILLFKFRGIIFRFKKTVLAAMFFFALPWYFIVDPLAVSTWKIWAYGSDKILNVWVAGTVIEEWLWMILVAFLFSALTLILKKRGYRH